MAKTMTREQIKQLIRDGRAEVNFGDIETVRSGSHIELRMMPSKKIVQVRVENTHFQNGRRRAVRELAERHLRVETEQIQNAKYEYRNEFGGRITVYVNEPGGMYPQGKVQVSISSSSDKDLSTAKQLLSDLQRAITFAEKVKF